MSENKRDLKARVLEYLEANRGNRIYLHKISESLGETERRVQQAISRIRRQDLVAMKTISQGYTWYVELSDEPVTPVAPVSHHEETSYKEISTLQSGAVLMERNDGAVFKAILTRVE